MAPPYITNRAADLRARKEGDALASAESPNKVTKPAEKPKMECFSKFPTEIQHMIWSEAIQKPACHTFKFAETEPEEPSDYLYMFHLKQIPIHQDPSAYRYWKSLKWCHHYKLPVNNSEEKEKKKKSVSDKSHGKAKTEKPKLVGLELQKFNIEKDNQLQDDKPMVVKSHESFSRLANVSFELGFRASMVQFDKIVVGTGDNRHQGAAMDAATDLVILEFDRGETASANAWFEHTGLGDMDITSTRMETQQLKRVAVHYKKAHSSAFTRGPFQCWCLGPQRQQCFFYKACPMEQACFLDCFGNLEEFYYVVEVYRKAERAWLEEYRTYARQQGYKLNKSADQKGAKLELAHFYDQKNEYLQLCPRALLNFLPLKLRTNKVVPLDAQFFPRDCLTKVMDVYKGKTGKDDYGTPLEKRLKVRFGMLVSYKIEK